MLSDEQQVRPDVCAFDFREQRVHVNKVVQYIHSIEIIDWALVVNNDVTHMRN